MDDLGIAVIMQLYYERFNPVTIQFLHRVYPSFKKYETLGYLALSKIAFMSQAACGVHVARLTERGVLQRKHYRGWGLSDNLRSLVKENILLRGLNGGNRT